MTIVGCSPATPDPGGANSSYLVEDGGRLLVDFGPGALSRLRLTEDWPQLDAIVISHLHLDHWGDLVPWLWHATERITLWLPPGGHARLRSVGAELGFGERFAELYDVHEYEDGGRFEAAGFRVASFRVPHYEEPTWALRIEGSKTLAYSADSGPTPALAEAARGADLFLCEATLAGPDDRERGHLMPEEAAEAFAASGAGRLLITHRAADRPLPAGLERAQHGDVHDV
jgi:ribonuclease BN (tRNA processing enzyme)